MAKNKLGKIVTLGAIAGSAAWIYKKYDTIKSMYNKVTIFKGQRHDFDTFEGESIACMFSGVLIDLSDAEFAEEEVYLDIYSLCSGVRILIPKDVEVVIEGSNKASGVQVDQDDDCEKTKTLFINYNIIASGLLITDNVDECCCEDDCCDDDSCCDDENCNDGSCNDESDSEKPADN